MKHHRIVITLFVVVFLVMAAGCTEKSSRDTPVVRVIQNQAPSVVNIRTENIVDLKEHPYWGRYGEQLDSIFKEYYGKDYSKGKVTLKSLGSGVIISQKGLIVTNAHVVEKASNIFVVLKDGKALKAQVIATSKEDDLALIKTDQSLQIRPVRFAEAAGIMIGETVIAIGNPFGFENSVTLGIISGIDRSFKNQQCGYSCSGLLQTDASINPGNSGGALLNLDGELVGINLAVYAGAQNIGFAIPVDRITTLLEKHQ